MKINNNKVRIGTSGWMYKHWKGLFYPKNIQNENMFNFYAKNFLTVEINNTFYRLPKPETVQNWEQKAPKQFLFAVKANRFITHMKKLKDPLESVERFINTIKILDKKLGPILFQFPTNWQINKERFEKFVEILPSGYHYIIELRHSSWYVQDIYDCLKKYHITLCFHDFLGDRSPQIITTDIIYIRFHGPEGYYRGKYSTGELTWWAIKISEWEKKGIMVFAYFNNDANAYAVNNALKLKNILNNIDKK